MVYGKMPMIIFILASGYLFTVYLLLALAKRAGQRNISASSVSVARENHSQQAPLPSKVTEVSSLR